MTPEAALAGARFLHYMATLAFFGVALFPVYTWRAADLRPEGVERLRRSVQTACAAAALVSGLLWLMAAAASMTSDLSGALDPSILWIVTSGTDFGQVWAVRLALAAAGLAAALAAPDNWRVVPVLAGLLLASIAMTGHARVEEGALGLLHVVADAVHLLAAGAWLGGLIPLAALMAEPPPRSAADSHAVAVSVARFSGMGYAAVAALLSTGIVNSWLLLGPLSALVETTYGRMLALKVALFALMLLLAVANRFWISPNLAQWSAADEAGRWRTRLRRHAFTEQAIGVLVVVVVSLLGMTDPGATLEQG